MKNIFKITAVALVFVALSTQTIVAQKKPVMSSLYTVDQIDVMYKAHQTAHQQDTHAPQNISAKFIADFPNARDVSWEKSNSLYEVEFEIKRQDYQAYYDMNGNLVMYEYDLPIRQLPAIVKNAALAKYPNFRFEDVNKIEKGNETFYKVELEKGEQEMKLILKNDGTIISEYID